MFRRGRRYCSTRFIQSNPLTFASCEERTPICARYTLGKIDFDLGITENAVKHWMISAAAAGHDKSLRSIDAAYRKKCATKDQYEKALRAHQKGKQRKMCKAGRES